MVKRYALFEAEHRIHWIATSPACFHAANLPGNASNLGVLRPQWKCRFRSLHVIEEAGGSEPAPKVLAHINTAMLVPATSIAVTHHVVGSGQVEKALFISNPKPCSSQTWISTPPLQPTAQAMLKHPPQHLYHLPSTLFLLAKTQAPQAAIPQAALIILGSLGFTTTRTRKQSFCTIDLIDLMLRLDRCPTTNSQLLITWVAVEELSLSYFIQQPTIIQVL